MKHPGVIVFAYHNFGYTGINLLKEKNIKIHKVFTHRDQKDEVIWFKSVSELCKKKKINWQYVDDLTNFVELVLKKQPENYRLYNCGYGKAISIKELVNKIISISGKDVIIEHDLSKPTIKTSLTLNCDLAKQELDWQPITTLENGIAKTISWWHANVKSE